MKKNSTHALEQVFLVIFTACLVCNFLTLVSLVWHVKYAVEMFFTSVILSFMFGFFAHVAGKPDSEEEK